MKIFRVVTLISMVLTISAAALSMIGITITGLYPGIIVLFILAIIPIVSRLYSKKIQSRSIGFQRKFFVTCTIVNVLLILVVLWMTMVIVHDRVLGDCC